jgi:hypothetical protein
MIKSTENKPSNKSESKINFSIAAKVLRSKNSTKEERSKAAAALGAKGGGRSHSGDGKKSKRNS